MGKKNTELQFVPLNRGNIELKFDYPYCGPGTVQVYSLPKGQITSFVSKIPPKPVRPVANDGAEAEGAEAEEPPPIPVWTGARKAEPDLLFRGEVVCCANVHMLPLPLGVPVMRKHDPVGLNAESYFLRYGGCLDSHMMLVEQACCTPEALAEVQATRDELTPPEQMTVAAEKYGEQIKIGVLNDGGCGPNVFSPHLQCCEQKLMMSSAIYDSHGKTKVRYHDVMTPTRTPLCCDHACWYDSSFCCKHQTCCTCDFLGWGQSRMLRFRCCCYGEIQHTYPLFKTTNTLSGRPEPGAGRIVVMGEQSCCFGNVPDDSLVVLIQPPLGTTMQQVKVLTAIAYELGTAYLKVV